MVESNLSCNLLDDSHVTAEDENVIVEGSPLYEYLHNLNLVEEVSSNDLHLPLNDNDSLLGFWYGTSLKSQHYFVEYGKKILESKIILEEDLDYLCFQFPQQYLVVEQCKHKCDSKNKSQHSRYFILAAYIVGALACVSSFLLPASSLIFFGVCAFFVFCFHLRLQIVTELWKRKHDANILLLHNFISSCEKLSWVIRRSICLIQEMEVVTRGYKLVNGSTPIVRLERSCASKTFPKLRVLVLRTLINSTLACRDATKKLFKYQLEDVNDCSYYMCNVPLDQLGMCFSQDISCEDLYQLTNGFSLGTLKSLNQLYMKQRSELLTRIYLTLSSTTWNFEHNNKSKPTSLFATHLHSLQAHLRAALYKSMECGGESCEHVTADALRAIGTHLDSGKDCWMNCMGEIERLHCNSTSSSSSSSPTPPVYQEDDEAAEMSDEEEFVEDRVFEAVSDGAPPDHTMDEDVEEATDREGSAPVIRELQSVLSFLTSSKRREVWKRQLFPTYRSKPTSASDDAEDKVHPTDAADDFNHHSILNSEEHVIEEGLRNGDDMKGGSSSPDSAVDNVMIGRGKESLKCFKKAAPPGRPPSRKHLRIPPPPVSHLDDSSSVDDVNENRKDWCSGLGIGFSHDLALQVVNIAKQRPSTASHNEELVETYGDDPCREDSM